MFNFKHLLLLMALLSFVPIQQAHAFSWQKENTEISLRGALRMSVNNDECGSACLGSWRSTDPADSLAGKSSTYLSGNVSSVQVDGEYQLDKDFAAVFKSEWKINPASQTTGNTLTSLDQFLGIETKFGSCVAGIRVTPYLQTGTRLDPFRRDALATRFFVDIQSALQHNTGKGRGRSTGIIRYDSPKFIKSLEFQAFVGLDETSDNDHSFGGGLHYGKGPVQGFAQYYNNNEPGDDAAFKIGGKYTFKDTAVFGQYELDLGLISLSENISSLSSSTVNTAKGDNTFENNVTTGADVWYLGVTQKVNDYLFIAQYGQRADSDNGRFPDDGHKAWVLGASFYMKKFLYFYTGYLQKVFNDRKSSDRRITLGATLTF
jgi:hypothetical protein